jgi:serine/threonine-protein kinase
MARPFLPDNDPASDGPRGASSDPADGAFEMDTAAAPQLRPGTILAGRYEILQLLGWGGMGAVYRARDRALLDREVALKVIRPEFSRDAEVRHRFERELRVAGSVTHPNIGRIYDLGQAEGNHFIAMEFIEGKPLSAILEAGRLPAPEAAGIIIQVAHALKAAHAQGLVHRDLKPQNLLMDSSGRVVVMDFGMLRPVGSSDMTHVGGTMGTPMYMSPEQVRGQMVETRSDLYALGVIFYELLTGRMPFETDNPITMLMKRLTQKPVPPVALEPSVPKALNEIVLKMMAIEPNQRYQSAEDILQDLNGWEKRPTLVGYADMFRIWAVRFADRVGWLSMVEQEIIDAFCDRRPVRRSPHT